MPHQKVLKDFAPYTFICGFISQELASILLDSNQVCAATQINKDLAPYFIHFNDIRINIEFILKDEN